MAPAAEATVRYVAPTGANAGDCSSSAAPCATPQYAVDQSSNGDEIRLAKGTYAGVTARSRLDRVGDGEVYQVLYLKNKAVSVLGGYTTGNWVDPDPVANLTTLDAGGQGRVVYMSYADSVLYGLRLTGGTAFGQEGWADNVDAGGGVYAFYSSATFDECQVVDNGTLNGAGGGIALYHSGATVFNCDIVGNRAEIGGGIAVYNSEPTITACTVAGNQARYRGGGLLGHFGAGQISENAFTSNLAGEEQGSGAGIQDVASAEGASSIPGVYGPGTGGAIYLWSTSALVRGNAIFGNHATGSGGAVFFQLSSSMFAGNVLRHNTAEEGAGALMILASDEASLINNVIADNAVVTAEAALGTRPEGAVDQNRAGSSGASAITLQYSAPFFGHNTIARNHGGNGVAVDILGPHPNTMILANNIVADHETGVSVGAGSSVVIDTPLWYGNLANTAGAGYLLVLTEVNGDPQFVNPDAGNYRIGLASAARDQGTELGTNADLDGDPRPVGAGPDIGADEYPIALQEGFGSPPAGAEAPMALVAGSLGPDGPQYDAIIAAAANTGGVNLTRWLTDVDLFFPPLFLPIALRSGDDLADLALDDGATVEVALLKANQANLAPATVQVNVPQGQTARLANILGTLFKFSNAALGIRWQSGWGEVNSRFFNTASACGGTFGMYIPAERPHEALTFGHVAYFHHLSYSPVSTTGFRTNFGFANATARETVVEIVLYGDNGAFLGSQELTLQGFEHRQITRIHGLWKTAAVNAGYAVVWVKTPGAWVHTYAMLIDNASGDPVYMRPLLEAPAAADSRYDVMLSAAANTTGENATRWLTDDDLVNPLAYPAVVQLDLLRANQANTLPAVAQFVIPPRQTLRLANILGSTFSAGNAAIGVKLMNGWVGIDSRFYNTASACGGTYGMYIPGEPRGDALTDGNAAFFQHLSYSKVGTQGFRTNIGFANNSDLITEVVVSLYGDDGSWLAGTTRNLQPYEHRQITRIHKELGTDSVTHGTATVTVTTPGGRIHTYAMLIDNASGDPIYMLPTLSSQQWTMLWPVGSPDPIEEVE